MKSKLYKANCCVRGYTGVLEKFIEKGLKTSVRVIASSLLILHSFSGFTQTSPLSFTALGSTNPDMNRPGAGLEQWNGQYTVNTGYQPLDVYYRFSYTDISPYNNPGGSYDFSLFDSKINDAISKNQKFSFCIMQMCGICGQGGTVGGSHLFYPVYLHNQMQSESVKDFVSGGKWTPNYNSPSWLSAWKALNVAVNNHIQNGSYNGVSYKTVIGYIDISGYGDYGEWTNNKFDGPSGSIATVASLNSIIDATVQSYANFQCVALQATFDGGTLSNTNIPPAVGYYALTTSNNKGKVGWRRDSWGWTDWYNSAWTDTNPVVYNGLHFDAEINNRWKIAPVVGEPADLGLAGNGGSAFFDLVNQMGKYHVNSFGNGNLDNNAGNATAQNNFRAASKAAGYRLALTGGNMTTTLSAGGAFSISVNWQNSGVAPTYENWTVVYELRNASNAVVWTANSSFNPRLFLPGSTTANDNYTLSSVPQGNYSLYMIVKDPNGYRKPLPLSITGRNSDGSYLLRSNIPVGTASTNTPPTANAGSNQTIQLPTNSANLAGTGSDADGTVASYAWTWVSGPAGAVIASPSTPNTGITGLVQGVYVFSLKVTDNKGASTSSNVTITVNAVAVNKAPVAVAGADLNITLPTNSINLNGSASSDPDGSITSFLWTKISGPASFTITNSGAASTAVSNLAAGVYSIQLKVTDNSGAIALDTIKVVVNAAPVNQPPVANAGGDINITLPTNTATLNGTASNDPDGSIAGYAWTQLSGPASATITSSGNATSAVSNLQTGVYIFSLRVADNSGANDIDSVRVTVSAAVNQPPVANAGNSRSIAFPLNNTVLDGSLSSDPDGSIVSYSWVQISGPSASTLAGGTSVTATASNLLAGQYTFELTVKDNAGASSTAQVKISVNAAGAQPPVANAGADISITLPVNGATINGSGSYASAGSITNYAWSEKSGPSSVAVTNTIQNVLTGLKAGIYVFYLTVTDNNGAKGSDSVRVTVNASANQAPVANAGSSVTITLPRNTATLDGSASFDPDGSIATYSWTKISGPNNPSQNLNNPAILILNGLVAGQYTYQLTVTDNSGASASAQVKIRVTSAANVPPVANAGSNKSITAPANSVVLDGTASSDPDGNIVRYQWVTVSGPGSITINNSSSATPGVTGLQTGAYIFELTVTDNNGATSKDQVNVTVFPQAVVPNQKPVANAGNNITITAPANSVILNGSSSFDPDGTIAGYNWKQISGPSASAISGSASTSATVSLLTIGQYVFELKVSDNNGATNTDQVTVTVNPEVGKVNLPPVAHAGSNDTISLPNTSYTLNGTHSMDPDGTIQTYQWQQMNGPNAIANVGMNSPEVVLNDLEAGQYEFQLTVVDNGGATSKATMKLTVEQPGVPNRLSVFPNPARDVIHSRITSAVNGTVKIYVYDLNGRLVKSAEVEKTSDTIMETLNVSQLASGMYTIQTVIANRKTMIAKFIKN